MNLFAIASSEIVGYAGIIGLAFGAFLSYRSQVKSTLANERSTTQSISAEFYDELVKNQGHRIKVLEENEARYERQAREMRSEIDQLRLMLDTVTSRLNIAARKLHELGGDIDVDG